MRGLIDVLYQARSLFSSLVEFNILFEIVSLLHLIQTEASMSLAEVLYLKRVADKTVAKRRKIISQELCILRTLQVMTVFLVFLRTFGLLP